MKFFLLLIFSGLTPYVFSQDRTGIICLTLKDGQLGSPVNYATVSSFKQGFLAVAENGKLSVYYREDLSDDTLYINSTGYAPRKITFAKLLATKEVLLAPDTIVLHKNQEGSKGELLNKYQNNEVCQWIGLPLNTSSFNYLQVGQIFPNTHQIARLKRIRLNQLYFYLPTVLIYDDGSITLNGKLTYAEKNSAYLFKGLTDTEKGFMHSYLPAYLQRNSFRLRIYAVDVKNQPIKELYNRPIIIDRAIAENMNIDLIKYDIAIPFGRFMVAVEWMPLPKNYNYHFWTKDMYENGHALRPFIGVNNEPGVQLNVMALDYGGNWKPFDYLSPYYTDLAMECEITY